MDAKCCLCTAIRVSINDCRCFAQKYTCDNQLFLTPTACCRLLVGAVCWQHNTGIVGGYKLTLHVKCCVTWRVLQHGSTCHLVDTAYTILISDMQHCVLDVLTDVVWLRCCRICTENGGATLRFQSVWQCAFDTIYHKLNSQFHFSVGCNTILFVRVVCICASTE